MDQDTERRLAAKARAGDQPALEELVAGCRERLESFVRARLGVARQSKLDPDDVLQETTARSLESIHRFEWRGRGSFESWLQGIAENVIREFSRKFGREPSLDAFSGFPASDPSPSRLLRRGERFERLQRSIDALPDDYRQVILLARIEGLKIAEIAERTGRSISSVKNLLLRGMRELRASLGDTESLHLPDRRLDVEDPEDDSDVE